MFRRCTRKKVLTLFVILLGCSVFSSFLTTGLYTSIGSKDIGVEPGLSHPGNGYRRDILKYSTDAAVSSPGPAHKEEGEMPESATRLLYKNSTTHKNTTDKVKHIDLNCSGPWPDHPECQGKMEWLAKYWTSDKCYAKFGVDGTNCSFLRYLSEVESACPVQVIGKATVRYDFSLLFAKMSENPKLDWPRHRISSHQTYWSEAIVNLQSHASLKHSRKKILLHIGALSNKAGFKFAENANHGGPLGELVQWSDLIACLYVLGHTIDITTEQEHIKSMLISGGSCRTMYDVIYTDIVGLKQLSKAVKLTQYRCLIRVLDSFGTEPQFNYKKWKPPMKSRKGRDNGKIWGNWNLNPRQFLTMYPHTPDNSFLGFVVGSRNSTKTTTKRNIGLVYGKDLYMWKGKRNYLDLISRYVDIHATLGNTQESKDTEIVSDMVPGYVTNHGILNSTQLKLLLQESKLFIGLGFPYEGPAPLEAIANGCIYLNPRIVPAIHRGNSKFLKDKPTLRSITSQNPYAEMFIREPHVFTFNMDNDGEVLRVMQNISKTTNPAGYIPLEFTYEGMLERVQVYLENQQFCSPHQWPSKEALISTISKASESCKDACYRNGKVCEPELFSFLNKESVVMEKFGCHKVLTEHSIHGPSFSSTSNTCSIQTTPLLYTCVGSEESVRRLCPCRTYRREQIALCETCAVT